MLGVDHQAHQEHGQGSKTVSVQPLGIRPHPCCHGTLWRCHHSAERCRPGAAAEREEDALEGLCRRAKEHTRSHGQPRPGGVALRARDSSLLDQTEHCCFLNAGHLADSTIRSGWAQGFHQYLQERLETSTERGKPRWARVPCRPRSCSMPATAHQVVGYAVVSAFPLLQLQSNCRGADFT